MAAISDRCSGTRGQPGRVAVDPARRRIGLAMSSRHPAGQATGRPWPFDAAQIRAPIHVFHGDSDTMAPLPVLRRTLAGAAHVTEERIYPGGMHLCPWVTRDRQAAMLAIVTA